MGLTTSKTIASRDVLQFLSVDGALAKKVIVYLEDCVGNQLTVANWVSPSNGPQSPITLCWDTTIVVPAATVCCARIRVWTDDVTEQFFQICSGDIRINRV
jgi:hypothetical protein